MNDRIQLRPIGWRIPEPRLLEWAGAAEPCRHCGDPTSQRLHGSAVCLPCARAIASSDGIGLRLERIRQAGLRRKGLLSTLEPEAAERFRRYIRSVIAGSKCP